MAHQVSPKPWNRAEHCRRIASSGGYATSQKYGPHHMRALGKAGAQVTIQRHGLGYWRSIMGHKGWSGRRVESLARDLHAGKLLATIALALALMPFTSHAAEGAAPGPECTYSAHTEDGGQFAVCPDGSAFYFDADGQPHSNTAGVPVRAPGWVRIA